MAHWYSAEDAVHTPAGAQWRRMLDAARGQALRLGDPEWTAAGDPYAIASTAFAPNSAPTTTSSTSLPREHVRQAASWKSALLQAG